MGEPKTSYRFCANSSGPRWQMGPAKPSRWANPSVVSPPTPDVHILPSHVIVLCTYCEWISTVLWVYAVVHSLLMLVNPRHSNLCYFWASFGKTLGGNFHTDLATQWAGRCDCHCSVNRRTKSTVYTEHRPSIRYRQSTINLDYVPITIWATGVCLDLLFMVFRPRVDRWLTVGIFNFVVYFLFFSGCGPGMAIGPAVCLSVSRTITFEP